MQQKDLIFAFNNPTNYPVGIINPETSLTTIPLSRWYWDPAVPKENAAFIREVWEENGELKKEYWVSVDEPSRNYRTWFINFIKQEYRVPDNTVPQKLHADHILSKSYAKKSISSTSEWH